jgi:MFS transporter, CP family, cyanate transporter
VQDVDVRNPSRTTGSFGPYLGIILIGANLRAPITSVGPVLVDIQRDLGLGGAIAGLLNALPLLTFAVLSLVAPGIGRRHGLERILGASVAAIAAGTALRSLMLPGALWLGTIMLSAGIAFGNVLLPALVKRDVPERAAGVIALYAAAMATMAGVAAGAAVPIARIAGLDWRWALGVWALLAVFTLLVWFPQLRVRQHHLAPAAAGRVTSVSPWRHPVGWQVSLFFACHSLIFYSLVDWFATYAASRGIAPASAGMMLLAYQVVAVATNLGTAPLLRRFDDQVGLGCLCGLLLLAGTTGLLLWPTLSLLWLVLAGLGAGVSMVTSLSLFGLRTRDHQDAAALSGMAQFVGYAGAAMGPVLIGILHDATGGWNGPFGLLIVASVLVTIFASLAGRRHRIGA